MFIEAIWTVSIPVACPTFWNALHIRITTEEEYVLFAMITFFFDDKDALTLFPGLEKAKIESEFNYQACCNDNTGLQVLGTEVYQPSTCSQRTCLYNTYSPFSLWISKQVKL